MPNHLRPDWVGLAVLLIVLLSWLRGASPAFGQDALEAKDVPVVAHVAGGAAHAGDITLRFDAPASVQRLIAFYGDENWWQARVVPKEVDGFGVTLYDYRAPHLKLRLYWEDAQGQGGYTRPQQFSVAGGDPAWAASDIVATGCPVGFNFIPEAWSDKSDNHRALRDLGRLGIRDVLINFYARHYRDMLRDGRLDRLLSVADEQGLRVWINTRDTEPLGSDYYPQWGLMSPEQVERWAFTYTITLAREIKDDVIEGDTGEWCTQWSLPHRSKQDILGVSAFVYDPRLPDPLPTAQPVPAQDITWDCTFLNDQPDRPVIGYTLRNMGQHKGKALTVRIALRTLRLWTVPPLWDDDYYESFYKPHVVGDLVENGRLREHPSFRGIATINEPTLTWQGGDVWHPSIERKWHEFLRARYGSVAGMSRAFGVDAGRFARFEDVPLYSRLVFWGAVHTAWSGEPGRKGLSREYEICRDEFKERMMNLVYQRAAAAFEEALPGKDCFVKFQRSGPSSIYGLAMQQADSAITLPGIQHMALDMYPIGHLEKATRTPAEAFPLFLSDVAYGVLLGSGQGKAAWVAETSFGRCRDDAQRTAAVERLALDGLFSSGVQRVLVWALAPAGWTNQDPYFAGADDWEQRTTPALQTMADFIRENQSRAIRLPEYDLAILVPRTDAMLWGGNQDHYMTGQVDELASALTARGFLVAKGVLSPESCRQARAIVLPGGYYLSDPERKLIRTLDKPVLIMGAPYVVDPVDGAFDRLGDDAYPYGRYGLKTVVLPDGAKVQVKRDFTATKAAENPGTTHSAEADAPARLLRAARRTTFAYELNSAGDAARVAAWWFRQTR